MLPLSLRRTLGRVHEEVFFGPAIVAFEYSSPDKWRALAAEMANLMREYNRSPKDTALGESEYLDVVGINGPATCLI